MRSTGLPRTKDREQIYGGNFPLRSPLGALLYHSMNTKSDIAYGVGLPSLLVS